MDWSRYFDGKDRGAGTQLPTYPFQRRRYWLERQPADVFGAGLGQADHPLLGAVVRLAEDDGAVLSGRLVVSAVSWLADHVVDGTVIFPGSGFVELAIRAGDEMGYGHLEELTLETPLSIPADGTILLQVRIGGADETRRRPVAIYAGSDDQWTRHATGILTDADPSAPDADAAAWPPPEAVPLPVTDAYESLAERGHRYGPAFQGLRAAWRHGTAILAEVALPATEHSAAARYGIHPALLDACLHAAEATGEDLLLPSSWTGVRLHATGATAVRVRMEPSGRDALSVSISDDTGAPLAEVRSIRLRPYDAGVRPAASPGGSAGRLFRVVWLPLGSGDLPGGDGAGGVVSVTRCAVLAAPGDPLPDPAMASAWDEHPEDRVLVDIDEDPDSLRLVPAVAASGEPRVAIRAGRAFVPRMRRAETKDPEVPLAGTALVVGGDAELPGLDVVTARTADRDQLARMLEDHRPSVVVVRYDPRTAQDLHELTANMDLSAFVMVSCGAFGDALARHRHDLGAPATSLPDKALPLLASAVAAGDPVVVAERMDLAELRALAASGTLPARWRSLVRVPARLRDTGESSLARRLAAASRSEQTRLVLALVRTEAAAVLGQPSPELIDIERGFLEQGFDSLTAVELRNRLTAATGLPLPSTIIFDHPSPAKLASWVRGELIGGPRPASPPGTHTAPASDDLVAVVGMACRFPGGADSPEGLWQVVSGGVDAVSGFPTDRGWDLRGLYDPDPNHSGTTYVREGGFVTGVADFDAEFFGISPREALAMDPQQRLLLEVSWEALERASIDPWSLRGSRTGVYVGALGSDYINEAQRVPPQAEGLAMTGNAFSVLSGRVSYLLGLEGPAVSVDTACSSSLVAMHLARQGLLLGECDLALAAGVTVFASPSIFVEFSRQRAIAPDGRCKAFSASADGLSTAEGVGVLVVERLSDARRNGHPVLAVVRGSAVNQDGASSGLTAPSGPSQERVIRAALANAGLRPEEVDAVEAHGTGTALGDPIEAQALIATYGQERDTPLWVGSVKSNIGHAQAAAGAAALIKTVLAFRHDLLPRTLHVDELSPHVDWSSGAVSVLTEPRPWPGQDGRPRRAGVSSFGISGTNAHIILEEAAPSPVDVREDRPAVFATGSAIPWVISGAGPAALRAQAVRLREFAAGHPNLTARTIASALTTRTALSHRALVVGTDRDELQRGLAELAEEQPATGIGTGTGEVVLVFPGQGSEWAGMCTELLVSSPVFDRRMRECDDALRPFTGWSLLDMVRDEATALERTDVVQPLLFAMMVSLAELWRQAGVRVAAVVGHSQGEIAAAYVAGALSLEDAARIVALRSQALVKMTGGGMAAVAADREAVAPRLNDRLSVAAVNGPNAVVVSGETAAIDELVEGCTADGLRARRLSPRYASHSSQVESLRDEILDLLAPVTPRPSDIAFCSTVTGAPVDTSVLDAEYWYRNLRRPVEFETAVRALLDDGHSIFVEVSPHPVLTAALTETFESAGSDARAVGTLLRGEGGSGDFLMAVGRAWAAGARVEWSRFFGGDRGTEAELPTYPFQRRRYLERQAADVSGAGLDQADHPLLGAVVHLAEDDAAVLSGRIIVPAISWLADHVVDGTVIFPGSGFVELAIRA
ncbi:acyltransferase domain-containing protein, partial [Actinoallomurus acaciae]